MASEALYAHIIDDQRWKREKLRRKLIPSVTEEELARIEKRYNFEFLPLLRHMLSKSKELYMINSCTGLSPYSVTFSEKTLKNFDNSLCLRIANCGCGFETWVSLDGPDKEIVFETIGGENIIKKYDSLDIYFEQWWGKICYDDFFVRGNPHLAPRVRKV